MVDGILDVLLVPMGAQYYGLRAVEVKRSRADFLHGFKEQYERYNQSLQSLYIAVPKDMVKRHEIPKEYGMLSISSSTYDCTCVRHPQLNSRRLTENQMWFIIWKIKSEFERQRWEMNQQTHDQLDHINAVAGDIIGHAVRKHLDIMQGININVTKEQESMIYVAGQWWEEQDFKQAITEMLKGDQK